MADDQQQTAAPDDQTQALLNQMLRQTLTGQAAQPAEPPHSGDNRTWGSLLGQALVGGAGPGSTDAQNEQAGLRALQQVGLGMMAGSDYSQARHSLGSIVAGAIGGAQESNAAQNAAQLEYQKTQQEMQLARIKEALPLLTLQQQLQSAAAARKLAGGGGTPPGANTSIGAVGGGTYEGAIAGREGTGANPNSTALGTGQFLASTWQDFAKANPELFQGMTPDQVLAARTDPALGTKAITWLAQQNADALTKAGVTPSGTSLGVAHYLGAGAAAKVMQAADNAPVSSFVSAAVVKANPELATMTAGQLRQRYANTPAPAFLGGPKPGTAPAPAVTAQTPPAASTAAPGVAQGDVAHPELAPGPPGSTGGAAIGIGAALAPPAVAGAPQLPTKGSPIPSGKLLKSDNADAIMEGVKLAQTTQPGGVQTAGPGAGPSLPPSPVAAPVATPQPGWGAGAATGYNVGTNGATPPPPPPAVQPVMAQPGAEIPPPVARVSDVPPPYVRGPLPADIQAQIDHPENYISPDRLTALRTELNSGDISKMAAARSAMGAAAEEIRAKAQAAGEAYHTNLQNIGTEAWKVRRAEQAASDQKKAEFQQQNATAAATHAQEVQMKSIESANTRLNAEASKQLERNDTVAKTYGASRDAGMNIVSNIDQVMPALKNLPDKAAPLLQNEQTRSSLASMFGWADPELSKHIDAADLFEQGMNRIATQLSPLAPVGTEKASMVSQYRSLLPTLAQSPEGRELGLQYARDLARNGIDSMNWLTEHKEDPAYFNKRLGVPDWDKALIGLQRDGPKMPKMPPIPSTFDSRAFTNDDRAANARYMASVKPGQPYYAWQPGADGHLHATRYDWQPGADGKLHAAPSEGGG